MDEPTCFPIGVVSEQKMDAFDESELVSCDNIYNEWGIQQASRPNAINTDNMTHQQAIAFDKERMILGGPKRPDVRVGDRLVLSATAFRMYRPAFSARHGVQESVLTISGIPEDDKPCLQSWRLSTRARARL